MALSFPLTMPAGGVDSQGFQILRNDLLSPELSGKVGGVTMGFPRWRMTVSLANADSDELDEWQAFVDALRGAQRTFLARDLSRPFGKAYPQGYGGMTRAPGSLVTGPFDGTAGGWSVLGDRSRVNLNSLPPSLGFARRDYLGFQWTVGGEPRRSLHRFCEAGTANGSGDILNRSVEPPVPTFVPSNAIATLAGADCVMRLIPGETNIGETDALHTAGGSVSAIQVVTS